MSNLLAAIGRLDEVSGCVLLVAFRELFPVCPRLCDWFAVAASNTTAAPDPDLPAWRDAELAGALALCLQLVRCREVCVVEPAADVAAMLMQAVGAEAAERLLRRGIAGGN